MLEMQQHQLAKTGKYNVSLLLRRYNYIIPLVRKEQKLESREPEKPNDCSFLNSLEH